jgi:hypothetical protein
MRVLPGVVGSRPRGRARLLLAAGTAAVAVTGLAGCAQFNSALGQRQAVVTFTNSASLAQRMAVRAACANAPDVSPQPVPSTVKTAYQLPQVIYQITQASNADVAKLETCLARYPSVAGVTLQDSSDEGN